MQRTLRLRSESLTELTTDELAGVVGAATETACVAGQALEKVTEKFFHSYKCTR